ncbi:MAG: LysR family transcriptional regulator [Bacteriovorax sp.]|nr:LysR family transcriptional regulator [Bacteriovorax sp.]
MKYRITDITNFVEACTCSTIVEAARKLEISQPALSESLKRLEKDLGYVVFYRSRLGIQLTASGKVFLNKAQILVQSIDNLEITNDKENVFGGRTITIGCHSTVAQYSIPKALSYLKKKAPDYKIELRHDLSRNIQTEIQRGNIDIGIIINPIEVPDLIIQKLAIDEVGVWAARSIKEFDTIICNLNLFQTQSILKKWKNKPPKIISTDSLELICKLVDEKIGYGILPERAVWLSGLNLKNLKSLPSFKDEICLVYRPEFGKSPFEKITITALKDAIDHFKI